MNNWIFLSVALSVSHHQDPSNQIIGCVMEIKCLDGGLRPAWRLV